MKKRSENHSKMIPMIYVQNKSFENTRGVLKLLSTCYWQETATKTAKRTSFRFSIFSCTTHVTFNEEAQKYNRLKYVFIDDVNYLIRKRLIYLLCLSGISTPVSPGWHARYNCTLQVAKLLQHPDGAPGAATTHDLQGEHEASAAAWRPDLHQLKTPPPLLRFCHFTPFLHHETFLG